MLKSKEKATTKDIDYSSVKLIYKIVASKEKLMTKFMIKADVYVNINILDILCWPIKKYA